MAKSSVSVATESLRKMIVMKKVGDSFVPEDDDFENKEELDIVLLIFVDEDGKFYDARLVQTALSRTDFTELIQEYVNFILPFEVCHECDLQSHECIDCDKYEFNMDEFLAYAKNFNQTYEIKDSGITVYNKLKVNTTKK